MCLTKACRILLLKGGGGRVVNVGVWGEGDYYIPLLPHPRLLGGILYETWATALRINTHVECAAGRSLNNEL